MLRLAHRPEEEPDDHGVREETAEAVVDRPAAETPRPAKPKDGDRRHRGVDLARLERRRKEAARQWNLDVGWTDAPGSQTSRLAVAEDLQDFTLRP